MSQSSDRTLEIQVLLERLRNGDSTARDELLIRAHERLGRLAHKMLGSYASVRRWEETGDVLQNGSLRLYRALGDVTPASALDFFRLAALQVRRELIDMARHYSGPEGLGSHHASRAEVDDWEGTPRGVDEPTDPSLDLKRLAAWTEFHLQVESLPSEEHEAFDLLWYQGLSQDEAASLLNVSVRTIKRRWRSARILINQAMKGELPE